MIIAAIPVRNNLKWTAPIVEQLLLGDEIDELWIYDNGSTDGTETWVRNRQRIDSRLSYFDASDMRFYEMWNDMILYAAENHAGSKLAILNNDIRLPHMALKTIADNMDDYKIAIIDKERTSFQPIDGPHPKQIGWWHRAGWAFMLDIDFWNGEPYAIDPRFNLWWGDDHLFRMTEHRGGKICSMIGVGCDHGIEQSHGEYQGNKEKDVSDDMILFNQLWS